MGNTGSGGGGSWTSGGVPGSGGTISGGNLSGTGLPGRGGTGSGAGTSTDIELSMEKRERNSINAFLSIVLTLCTWSTGGATPPRRLQARLTFRKLEVAIPNFKSMGACTATRKSRKQIKGVDSCAGQGAIRSKNTRCPTSILSVAVLGAGVGSRIQFLTLGDTVGQQVVNFG